MWLLIIVLILLTGAIAYNAYVNHQHDRIIKAWEDDWRQLRVYVAQRIEKLEAEVHILENRLPKTELNAKDGIKMAKKSKTNSKGAAKKKNQA